MDERPDPARGPESCPAPAALIDASEGTLPEAQQMAVDAHVVRCAACRDFLQRLDSSTHASAEFLRMEVEGDDEQEDESDDDHLGEERRAGVGDGESWGRAGATGLSASAGALRESATGMSGIGSAASPRASSRTSRMPRDGAAARFTRFQRRLHEFKQEQIHFASAWRLGRWLPVAAMLLVLVVGLLLSRPYATVIRADALLERAVFRERSRPVGLMQRLTIQLTAPTTPASSSASGPGVSPMTPASPLTRGAPTTPTMSAMSTMPLTGDKPPAILRLEPFSMTREVPVGRGSNGDAGSAEAGAEAKAGAKAARARARVPQVAMGSSGATSTMVATGAIGTTGAMSASGAMSAMGAPGSAVDAPRVEAVLARIFADHRLDWQQPLSVSHFQAWRTSRRQKWDHVTRLGNAWRELRTTTTDGLLREVQLVVHADTYHPVKVVMLIDGIGCLKIEKHNEWLRTPPAAPAAAPATTLSGSAAPVRRVTETRALSDDLRLPEPPDASTSTAVIPQPGLSRWLDQNFGQRPARDTFVPDLLRLIARVKGRLAALQHLAARYPEAETLRHSRTAREAFHNRLDPYYRALSTDLDALNHQLSVLVGSESRPQAAQHAPADWQRRTASGSTHAHTLEQLLKTLLTYEDLPADESAHGRGPLRDAFNALWDAINTTPSASPPRP